MSEPLVLVAVWRWFLSDADMICRCDIEQEVNGLYSYDRRAKIPASDVKAIIDDAQRHYYEHVAPK